MGTIIFCACNITVQISSIMHESRKLMPFNKSWQFNTAFVENCKGAQYFLLLQGAVL